jgi:DNA mismatch endonuclease (patch repair protein)
MGARFRVDYPVKVDRRVLRVDVAFPKARVAVFVNGCYWHGCEQHLKPSKSHTEYWGPKIAGNRRRDDAQDEQLRAAGWTVIRSWEHESAAESAARIIAAVRPRIAARRNAEGAEAAMMGPRVS